GCGLIHRDIKPSNLLLTQAQGSQSVAAGQVKILDMGLARLQSGDGTNNGLTKLGTVVGTMEYVAPEQARNSSTVDGRADLYSLGCTFYFLLTGQTPFKGSTPTETVMARFSQEPAPLDSFRKDVPTTVQAILKKLMALKPEDRFQSAAEVANALAAHCAQPASSVPAGNSAARP